MIFKKWGIYISILFAIIVFFSKIGPSALNPTEDNWLRTSHSDWTPDYVAWMYYRQAEWSFPIGIFDGYSYPEKISVGLTGAIPLLAIPFKLLDPVLPEKFQYFGIWLLLCFILQAYFGYKLLDSLKIENPIVKTLGACIFVLSYSFLDRIGHMNLCAHWTVLASIYWYFKGNNFRQGCLAFSILSAMSVAIHPYLILFPLAIGFAYFLKLTFDKSIVWWKAGLGTICTLFSAMIMWFLLGNHLLDSSQASGEGFGIFSANLNTFITPKIDTPLSSAARRFAEEQYEGVAYLGMGFMLMLLFVPILIALRKITWKWKKEYNAIFFIAFILFAFAVTHKVTLNHKLLLTIPIPNFVLELGNIFRASGRYVWLLQYLILAGIMLFIAGLKVKNQWKYSILGFILLVNIIDFSDLIKRNIYIKKYFPSIEKFEESKWEKIIDASDKLRMYPAYSRTYNEYCDDMEFAYLAAKKHKNINTGHLARFNSILREERRSALKDSILNVGSEFTLEDYSFITGKEYLEDFMVLYEQDKHTLFEINGYFSFIPNHQVELVDYLKERAKQYELEMRKESFWAFAQRWDNHYFLIAVRDEASSYLDNCKEMRAFAQSQNSQITEISFRESYVGLFEAGTLIEEYRGKPDSLGNKNVSIEKTLKFEENEEIIKKDIEIFSSGKDNENIARIFVDNQEYSVNGRGLNIVVLDRSGQVVESTSFDTYINCHHFTEHSERSYKVWKIN